MRRIVVGAVLLAVLAGVAPVPAADAGTAPRRVVVTFADGTTAVERAQVLAAAQDAGDPANRTGPVDDAEQIRAMTVGGAVPVAVAVATPAEQRALARDARVTSVVEDIPVHADAVVVNDPAWPQQDGVRRIRVNEVWEQTTGASDVVIAVIDTGVDPGNRDVAGRLLPGYDFVNRDADTTDDNGHGTAVATVAAAASDDFGVAGVCWRCRIMPVKVLDAAGNGFLSDAALGIAWAVDHGADILNVSLGASGSMPALDTALDQARKAGVLVVASAGNAGNSAEQWPAADPRVMGVAAVDAVDRRADYSSYGDWVDVAAPGCNPSGWLANATIRFCGTSSAAPLVSGSAALLVAARDATGPQVRAALRDTAVPAGSGLGAGRIDAVAALRQVPTFADTAGSVHAANIETLAAAGITTGCAPGRYCPSQLVTRAQIATFLDRALDLPDGTNRFTDVPAGHPHAAGIAAVAAAGITTGCTIDRFCPADVLTRGQMASLLRRALDLPAGPPRFADVPAGYAHAEGIWAIAAAGVTAGCEPDRFCPAQPVDRAQMASFLVRAFDL